MAMDRGSELSLFLAMMMAMVVLAGTTIALRLRPELRALELSLITLAIQASRGASSACPFLEARSILTANIHF